MALKFVNNKMVELCDCIGCPNKPMWVQEFTKNSRGKTEVIKTFLCSNHHFILRTKVPKNQELDEDVLKWLLIQSSNPNHVTQYGIVKGPADVQLMKELRKIKL